MKSQHQIIRNVLIGRWLAPHEVRSRLWERDFPISPEATTARMRDLRKLQFGGHNVIKRRRPGTRYYEYSIPTAKQEA